MKAESPDTRPAAIPEEDPRGDLIVIGGGCYGSYHARQLDRARTRGRLDAGRIVIVDRDADCAARREFSGREGFLFITADWTDFYAAYFAARRRDTRDHVVPTPISPHLLFEWLRARAARRLDPSRVVSSRPAGLPDTPFAVLTDTGTGLLSFATWVCPVTCIEPDLCPETRGPKDWEMDEAVFSFARRQAGAGEPLDEIFVFRIRHHAFGVASFAASTAVEASARLDRLVERAAAGGRARRVLVATVSSCHGVMNEMEIR